MFPLQLFINSSAKQDLFTLTSHLRRMTGNQVLQLCPVTSSIKPSPNEGSKMELPSLPVQPLDQMLKKYIKSIKPFVDSSQFERTKELARKFSEDETLGKRLQELLQDRARKNQNWLADWWLNIAYLEYRNPVIVYSSPGLVWPEQNFKSLQEQLIYAAQLIVGVLEFNKLVEEKKIPQESLGKQHPLCMSQYDKIFGTCRIPKYPKDELCFQDKANPSSNIVVMYNEHLFSIPAFESGSRKPLNVSQFYAMLNNIVEEGSEYSGPPIGILTTEHRDIWAKTYEELKKDQKNREILEEFVEKALFIVCIDKPLVLGSGLNYSTRCSKLLLHGFGRRGNAGNRWYDKTVQFIVGAENDGVGIAYEHSPAEGGPIGVLTDYVVQRIKEFQEIEHPVNYPMPLRLEFVINDSIKEAIDTAGKAVDKINDELDVFSWTFSEFGKNTIKKLNVSPDSYIQIAIQFAFFKVHQHPAAQYESGTLRKYIYGRTDIIRTCSEEVVNFCKAMTDVNATIADKEKALRAALVSHKTYAQEVIEGRGVDRHLLGLKILAKTLNITDMKIFSDVAFQRSTYFQLSTSNVPTKCDGVMVYGPLVDDGYACCYNPRDDSINFGMSAWSNCKYTRLTGYKRALEEALLEMKRILTDGRLQSKL